jgi:hypothetical protein
VDKELILASTITEIVIELVEAGFLALAKVIVPVELV